MGNMIELIKELRARTGAGMMDCKKALEESDQNVEKAINWLREKGIVKAQAKASRIAAEGLTKISVNGNDAIIIEVNSETDFVAKSNSFHELVDNVATKTLASKPETIEKAKELTNTLFADATVSMGEKLDYRRFKIMKKSDDQGFGNYEHAGGRVSVLVRFNKKCPSIAKNIAMHIAANSPRFINDADVGPDFICNEIEVAKAVVAADPKLAGKPSIVINNAINGKVKKAKAEAVLTSQAYLFDPTKTVGDVLKENDVSVLEFVRYEVGEGIEKRQDNFAEEVMKEVK